MKFVFNFSVLFGLLFLLLLSPANLYSQKIGAVTVWENQRAVDAVLNETTPLMNTDSRMRNYNFYHTEHGRVYGFKGYRYRDRRYKYCRSCSRKCSSRSCNSRRNFKRTNLRGRVSVHKTYR